MRIKLINFKYLQENFSWILNLRYFRQEYISIAKLKFVFTVFAQFVSYIITIFEERK